MFKRIAFLVAALLFCFFELLVAQFNFGTKQDYPVGSVPRGVFASDLNGDGFVDLVVSNHGGGSPGSSVSVLLNKGNGMFNDAVPYAASGYVSSVFAADLNGDGYPDIIVGHDYNNFSVLFNSGDGNGTFGSAINIPLNSPRALFAADLDGDGDQDLAVASFDDGVYIFKNNGTGTFTKEGPFPTGFQPISIFVADLDGDGDQDIVTPNYSGDNLSILWNDGHGVFSAGPVLTTDSHPVCVFISDLNRDGRPDLTVSYSFTNAITVFLNNGNGTFSAEPDYSTSKPVLSVVAADFDGDGFPDVAAPLTGYPVTDGNAIAIFRNNGDGTFATTPQVFPTNAGPWAVFASNFDGDGDLDVAVTNAANNNISVLLNLGNVSVAPDPPMVSAALDAGTGDKLVVKWSAPLNSSNITDYQIGWGPATNNYPNSKIVAADGHSSYRAEIDNLQSHDPYFVAIRSRNTNTGLMSNWTWAHFPDTAVYATIPVVLVYGWLGDVHDTWDSMVDRLKRGRFNYVWVANNIDKCGVSGEVQFEGNAQLLATFIDDQKSTLTAKTNIPIDSLDFIGHSMGGLIIRRYLAGGESWAAKMKNIKPRNVIMMGTPNGGVLGADTFKKNCRDREVNGQPCDILLRGIGQLFCAGLASEEFTRDNLLKFNNNPAFKVNEERDRYILVAGNIEPCKTCDPGYDFCPNDYFISVQSVYDIPNVPAQNKPLSPDGFSEISHAEVLTKTYFPFIFRCTGLTKSQLIYDNVILPHLRDGWSFSNDISEIEFSRMVWGNSQINISPIQNSFSRLLFLGNSTPSEETVTVPTATKLSVSISNFGSVLNLSLRTPGGLPIDSTTPTADSNVVFISSAGTTSFTVNNPQSGDWTVRIEASSLPDTLWPCLLVIGVADGVNMSASTSPSAIIAGDSVTLNVTLAEAGLPKIGDTVLAIIYPDSFLVADTLRLLDDGDHHDNSANDGTFGAVYWNIGNTGSLTVSFEATGQTLSSEAFRKEDVRRILVTGPSLFPKGDLNRDFNLTASDVVLELNCVFLGIGYCPPALADVNCDGILTATDVVLELNKVFLDIGLPCQ